MSVEWVTHGGKKILVSTYSNKNPNEMIQIIETQAEKVKACSGKVLMLDDSRDSYASQEFMDRTKKLGREILTK